MKEEALTGSDGVIDGGGCDDLEDLGHTGERRLVVSCPRHPLGLPLVTVLQYHNECR